MYTSCMLHENRLPEMLLQNQILPHVSVHVSSWFWEVTPECLHQALLP